MLKAVIFDMDGVIVDSEPLHRMAYYEVFRALQIDVSDTLYESFTGQATLSVCKQLCTLFRLQQSPETLVALKRQHFKRAFGNSINFALIEGALELIKDYYSNGLTLVLASSASRFSIDRIFSHFQLDPYFKAKLSGAELKASKPHPEIFINALKASGVDQSECMVIEDSTNGIEAAKAAGLFCVGFDSFHSKNQDYSKADLVVSNFRALAFKKAVHFL